MANRHFLNIGTDWDDTANWSATSGGAGGASVPTNADTVFFDVNSGPCTLDINAVADSVDLTAYTSTLTQSTFDLTIDLGFTIPAGTFTGGSGTLRVNGTFLLNGGIFTSPSGDFVATGNFTITSGTFNHNSGKVLWGNNASRTITTNGVSFNDISFLKTTGGGVVVTLADDFTVLGDIFVDNQDADAFIISPSGTRVITLKGNFSMIATTADTSFGSSNLTILMNDGGTQTLSQTGGNFSAALDINTAGTVQLLTNFTFHTSWTRTAGTFDQNGNTINFGGGANGTVITNGITFDDVEIIKTIGSGTVLTFVDDFTIGGNLTVDNIDGSPLIVAATGVVKITLKGNFSMDNTSGGQLTFGEEDLILSMEGVGTKTLSRTGGAFVVTIDINTAGTVQLATDFIFAGSYIRTTGTFDSNTKTLRFSADINCSITTNGAAFTSNVEFIKTSTGSNKILTLIDDITIQGNFDVNKTSTPLFIITPSGTRIINVEGNFSIDKTEPTGSLTFGNSFLTLKMTGSNAQTVSKIAGDFNANLAVNKAAETATLATDFSLQENVTIDLGTFSLNGFVLTVLDKFQINGGVFDGAVLNSKLITDSLVLLGGLFTATKIIEITGGTSSFSPITYNVACTFQHNDGVIKLLVANNCGWTPEQTFILHDMDVNITGNLVPLGVAPCMVVSNLLELIAVQNINIKIQCLKDISGAGGNGGTGEIRFNGIVDQMFGATGILPGLVVSKSAGVLIQTSDIQLSTYITWIKGDIDFLSNEKITKLSLSNNVHFLHPGKIIFNEIVVDKSGASGYTLLSALRVKNKFTLNDWAGSMIFDGDPIIVGGDILMGTTEYNGDSELQLSGSEQNITPAATWGNTGKVKLVVVGAESDLSGIIPSNMLREDGGFMLREDGDNILREGA